MAFVEEADLGFEGVRMGKGVIFLSHFQTSLLSSQRLFFFFFFLQARVICRSPAHPKSEKRLQNRDGDPWKVPEQGTGVLASGCCSNICLKEFVVYQGLSGEETA